MVNEEFPNKISLRSHVQSIHDEKQPFKCDSCPSYFGQKYILTKHIKSVHEKNNVCKTYFLKKSYLKKNICNDGFAK